MGVFIELISVLVSDTWQTRGNMDHFVSLEVDEFVRNGEINVSGEVNETCKSMIS